MQTRNRDSHFLSFFLSVGLYFQHQILNFFESRILQTFNPRYKKFQVLILHRQKGAESQTVKVSEFFWSVDLRSVFKTQLNS